MAQFLDQKVYIYIYIYIYVCVCVCVYIYSYCLDLPPSDKGAKTDEINLWAPGNLSLQTKIRNKKFVANLP